LRVSKNLSVIGFWNQVTFDGRVDPIFVPGTGRMPVSIEPLEYYGVPWLMQHNVSSHYGALASANLGGGWKARLGLFRSESDTRANHAEVIAGLAEDGTAVRRISKDPPHRIGSTSGEARLWRDLHEGPRLHTLTLSLRGRERISTFGGGTTITLPRAPVRGEQPDEPPFALTAVTRERIRQWTLGLAYQLSWKGLGSLSLGVQRTDYRDRVDIPNAGFNVAHDPIWLPTATVAFAAAKNLVVYGSYTRGIEASGVAPDTAANRTAVLPAKETRQMDAGVRWKSPLGMHVVAGLFSITKPYFAANAQNVYTELGTVEHRGAELSVSGSPLKGLRIIAGAVLLDARVTGSPQRDGRVGRVPFDKPRTTLSFNANYDVAQLPGLSLSVKAVHRSSRYADALDLVRLNPVTIIDTSLRYRIKISGTDAQLRLSVQNIGGAVDWQIVGSGGYQIYTDRQMSCALTINM
jgi:iron complex outermembrane receptor protein